MANAGVPPGGQAAGGPPPGGQFRIRWSLAGKLAVRALPVLALAVFPVWALLAGTSVPHAPCVFPGQPAATPGPPPTAPAAPAKLTLLGGQLTEIDFGRALAARTLTIDYGVTGTLPDTGQNPNLTVSHQEFLRSDQASLPDDRIQVAAWYAGGRVQLEVCVNRTGPKLADPGTYQGTVSIVDPRVARVDVPVVVNLSYPVWQWIVALLVVAALAGSWYAWLLQYEAAAKPGGVPPAPAPGAAAPAGTRTVDEYLRWCFTPAGIVTVVVGVAAALGVYNATYLSSENWGASAWQFLSVLGAMFSGFLAASTTIHLGAKVAGK